MQVSAVRPALGGRPRDICTMLLAFTTPGQPTASEQDLPLSNSGLSGQLPLVRPCTGELHSFCPLKMHDGLMDPDVRCMRVLGVDASKAYVHTVLTIYTFGGGKVGV